MNLLGERLDRGLSSQEAAQQIGVSQFVLLNAEQSGDMPRRPRDAKAIADFYGAKVTEIWPLDREAA